MQRIVADWKNVKVREYVLARLAALDNLRLSSHREPSEYMYVTVSLYIFDLEMHSCELSGQYVTVDFV